MATAILFMVGFVASLVIGTIWRGYVLSILWGWFIVPFGIPQIGVAWAIGLSMLVSMVTREGAMSKSDDEPGKAVAKYFSLILCMPLLALGIGWIVQNWMPA